MFEAIESQNLQIVFILTVGFSLASLFGYLSQIARLSPILGYLLAGFWIGPFSPGFVADLHIAEQLAEIGVILMMFGVGLHFKLEDLVKVKNIAIPGAIGQTLIAAAVGTLLIYSIGWQLEAGLVIGLAIGVASTVVLVRVLDDNHLLDTPQGHVAVGWLIVEDILTVAVLILIPTIAEAFTGEQISIENALIALGMVLLKFAILAALMFTVVSRFVHRALTIVARTREHELFTLTILAVTFAIATSSAIIFGTSIALGAFLAGMVIGQTDVRQQALANSLPVKDAFVVIFFLSVGMLFNPSAISEHYILFLGVLGIILIIKPLSAFLITIVLKYPIKTAVTVAIALAQIGEFSFILSEEAMKYDLLPDEGFDIIVACALVSISLNSILFRGANRLTNYLSDKAAPAETTEPVDSRNHPRQAIIVGFGPIGRSVANTLEMIGYNPTIIERNVDTVAKLKQDEQLALYGDASLPNILNGAQIESAQLLVITIPEIEPTLNVIKTARQLNPDIRILARARFTADQPTLAALGVSYVCCEEEAMKAFHEALLQMAEV